MAGDLCGSAFLGPLSWLSSLLSPAVVTDGYIKSRAHILTRVCQSTQPGHIRGGSRL